MKFKSGDRVSVAGMARVFPASVLTGTEVASSTQITDLNGDRGTFRRCFDLDPRVAVEMDTGNVVMVHPRQCARLRKKFKRRIWVHFAGGLGVPPRFHPDSEVREGCPACTEFVEVRRKT